ncbi:MAG: VanW family protein [Polyangiaceae bacterium]|nr:VanW family protein [Polyangiaceae bacterium]
MHFPNPDGRSRVHVQTDVPAQPAARTEVPRARRWGLRVAIVAVLLTGAAGASAALRVRYLPDALVLPGVIVDGERIPNGADAAKVRAIIETHAAALAARKVLLVMSGKAEPVAETTLGALGVRVDVDETMRIATRIGKVGDVLTRAETAKAARKGRIDVPLRVALDRDVAVPVLEKIKEAEDTQPVSARLDLEKHATIAEKEGRYIDIDATIAKIEARARDPESNGIAVEMPVVLFAPRVSSAFLKSLDISTVVAEYETFFSRGGDQKKRGKNIDNAAQKLDGLVMSPGELVSFNDVVGERSEANGFQKSWEIFKGEMVEGVGGGTCQVASTFHAAVFFAGFDVLERLPHSRPSAYIPMGLDSTVVYPAVDLKVRNPYDFPIVVHAKTEGGKLHIELLGKTHPVDTRFGRELVSTASYKRKVVEDAALSGKKVLVKQHGINGFRIKRSRVLKYADGRRKTETSTDFYPPTTEIYHVPVGFDVSLLPALPGGDGEDSDSGGAPAATPVAARASATTCADCNNSTDGVEFVNGPGAHTPTNAQVNPQKTMWMNR